MKSQPLTDFSHVEKQINIDFERRWEDKTLKGWDGRLDNIEEVLNNPLYCKTCRKLFSNDHTFVHHLSGKKHKNLEKNKLKYE